LLKGKGYKLIPGSMPTLNMPKKSIETPCPPPRRSPVTNLLFEIPFYYTTITDDNFLINLEIDVNFEVFSIRSFNWHMLD
jgi:hypothetical protein